MQAIEGVALSSRVSLANSVPRLTHTRDSDMPVKTGTIPRWFNPERFWLQVDQSAGAASCWPWTGERGRRGYGKAKMGLRSFLSAHRVALALSSKRHPPDMYACHHCDNPPCCNPAHLYWGTPKDNQQDCANRGRDSNRRGEKARAAKLTEENVRQIRRLYPSRTMEEIAADFGVTKMCISSVVRRKSWSHVND